MTNKLHILFALLAGYSMKKAVVITTPDSVRCWCGPRQYTHCTINPDTNEVSWIKFPNLPIKEWNKELMDAAEKYNAGKPGEAAVDEATELSEFWLHNETTDQNKLIFIHLIQDKHYDTYLRSYVDVSEKYQDRYIFEDHVYSGDEFRKSGQERWDGESLVNRFDTQVFIALAKRLYETQGIIANRAWFEQEVFPVFREVYSKELAEKTIRFVTMTDAANETISAKKFAYESGPVPADQVDAFIDLIINVSRSCAYI